MRMIDRRHDRKLWLRGLAVAASIASVAMPATTSAQAWIGELAARIAAEKRAANDASRCFAGVPANAEKRDFVSTETERLMAAYFALTSTSDPKALKAVLDMDQKESTWRKGADMRSFANLGSELDVPPPRLVRVAFEAGGDGESARSLWRSNEGGGTIYLADFRFVIGGILNNGFRISQLAIMPDTPEAVQLIYPFCSLKPDVPANLLSVLYGADGKPLAQKR